MNPSLESRIGPAGVELALRMRADNVPRRMILSEIRRRYRVPASITALKYMFARLDAAAGLPPRKAKRPSLEERLRSEHIESLMEWCYGPRRPVREAVALLARQGVRVSPTALLRWLKRNGMRGKVKHTLKERLGHGCPVIGRQTNSA